MKRNHWNRIENWELGCARFRAATAGALRRIVAVTGFILAAAWALPSVAGEGTAPGGGLVLRSPNVSGNSGRIEIDSVYYEAESGRVVVPLQFDEVTRRAERAVRMADGRTATIRVRRTGDHFVVGLSAKPDKGIEK
ncbi:MAG TPA: hypothetical protein PLK78_10495 [Verrucomicrobiota bacterium]|nr:hypothetical protein [Verrucomicrobiota bacterium]